tara:strand:+ start:607 stop:813 length:207 start_codon:yes stop_codon:yes gene_type:complete
MVPIAYRIFLLGEIISGVTQSLGDIKDALESIHGMDPDMLKNILNLLNQTVTHPSKSDLIGVVNVTQF